MLGVYLKGMETCSYRIPYGNIGNSVPHQETIQMSFH